MSEEDLKRIADEEEAKAQKEQAEATKSFAEVIADADKVYVVHIPEFGFSIRLKRLTVADWVQFSKEKFDDPLAYASRLVALMWKKADPTVDLERFNELVPMEVVGGIYLAIMEKTRFLSVMERLIEALGLQTATGSTPSSESPAGPSPASSDSP